MKSRIVQPAASLQPPETCTEHEECQVAQASHGELCDKALAHYEEVSGAAHHWNSLVPRAIEFYKVHGSRASVAAVDEDAPTLLDRIEKLELDPNFSSHYLYGFELCREQVKNIIKEHPAVSSSLPAEPTPLCTCLAAGNQVAWEYVHHTNDCAIYKAGEVAKQWLLDHPQLKHSRIFAGAAAWDRETVTLSSRDREIREVLEGLITCRIDLDTHEEAHWCWRECTPACLAARGLWERVQVSVKKEKSNVVE